MIYFIYDIECLPNVFTAVVRRTDTDTEWIFEVSDRVNQSVEFLSFVRGLAPYPEARMAGYNNLAYDYPVVHHLLHMQRFDASDAYIKSKQIIDAPFEDRFKHVVWERDQIVKQVDLMKMHGFDNRARSASLKQLEVALCMPNVVEFECSFTDPLPIERIPALLAYNRYDVSATLELHNRSTGLYDMRYQIGSDLGIDLENRSDIDLGERIFIEALEARSPGITGTRGPGPKRTTPRSSMRLGDLIFPYVQFETPDFQRVHQQLASTTARGTKGVFDKVTAELAGLTYKFGTGGIHAARENCTYWATPERRVITVDVASYYPNIAIHNGLYPEHLGKAFVEEYSKLYERRKQLKAAGETLKQTAIKLGLNAVFGKGGSPYSCMHDPAFLLGITINGQLLLCMLCEWLVHVPSADVFNVNTDGVTLAINNDQMPQVQAVIDRWQDMTGLTLEVDDWEAIYQRDVNNYLAVESSGKVKGKGAYEWRHGLDTGDNWHKNQSSKIIPIAVEEYLVNGVPVEQTVTQCMNPFRFMYTLKVQRSDRVILGGSLEDYEDDTGGVQDAKGRYPKRKRHTGGVRQQRVGRFYATYRGEQLWKIMKPLPKLPHHERPQAVLKGQDVQMCNDLHDFDWNNLDRSHYIQEAEELIKCVNVQDAENISRTLTSPPMSANG